MSDPRERIIKIKTGVVKRLAKEKTVYEKEASLQRERVQKYKDDGNHSFNLTFFHDFLTPEVHFKKCINFF